MIELDKNVTLGLGTGKPFGRSDPLELMLLDNPNSGVLVPAGPLSSLIEDDDPLPIGEGLVQQRFHALVQILRLVAGGKDADPRNAFRRHLRVLSRVGFLDAHFGISNHGPCLAPAR